MSPEAEKYISKMLSKEVPYQVSVLDYSFVIRNANVYPPGKLTAMFAQYLIENHAVQAKVVADIGCGCFALGIIAAKNGAERIIGTDINPYAIEAAKENVALYAIKQKTSLFQEEGVRFLLPQFKGKIDVLVAGAPWDSLSMAEFEKIEESRRLFSRSFYDVEDKFITEIMSKGFELLSQKSKMFITGSMRSLERIRHLSLKYQLRYEIVAQEDLHNDGNMHYILELKSSA